MVRGRCQDIARIKLLPYFLFKYHFMGQWRVCFEQVLGLQNSTSLGFWQNESKRAPWQHWIDLDPPKSWKMASVFQDVECASPIEVFALIAKFNEDKHPDKVNLSVGGRSYFFLTTFVCIFACHLKMDSYTFCSNLL